MMLRMARAALLAAPLLVLAGANAQSDSVADVDGARISAADPAEWLSYGRTYDEQRHSPLDQINTETVSGLGLAWWAEFDTDRGQEATPLVADGMLFTTTAWSKVYAYDAKTGRELWQFDPEVPGQAGLAACCDVVNRGAALWQGKVYVGTIDGRLIAIDAKTGQKIWETQTTDRNWSYTITGAPRVVKGKVIIGQGGADYGVRGYVSAYDAETGELSWRFYMAPNPQRQPDNAASDAIFASLANDTWSETGAWQVTGGGGTPWDAITYDEVNDLVLVGTGNGSPWNREIRSPGGGDNLFLASIVALRPDTGEYVWHYQTAPGETWDYTAVQHIMLADVEIDGATRRVVMQAPKNGFFYVLDAATGKLVSAQPYIPLDWASGVDLATGRPIENPIARFPAGSPSQQLPGPFGGHNWQPMAYNPATGLVYIPSHQIRGYYSQPESTDFTFRRGFRNYAMGVRVDRPATVVPAAGGHGDSIGELIAWDPARQEARWRLRFAEPWRSGVLTTAGGLVFHAVGPKLIAFDAVSGRELWQHDTIAHAIAPPISYEIDGEQYVALVVGYGGAGALTDMHPRRPGRLMVYKLGGTAVADPFPEVPIPPPLDLARAQASSGDVDAGRTSYVANCQPCHRANHYLPNLSRTPYILNRQAFHAVVLGGALVDNGMPSFAEYLNEGEVENLRAFFLAEAASDEASEAGPLEH